MAFTGFLVLVIPFGLGVRSRKKEKQDELDNLGSFNLDNKRDDYTDTNLSHM